MTASHPDEGSITVFVVGMVVALVVMAGLVFDGGTILASQREADAEAAAAARAGAEAVSGSLRSTGTLAIDPPQARAAAQRSLADSGTSGVVSVDGDEITVTVSIFARTQILSIVGIRGRTVTATATARPLAGATEQPRP